MISFSLVVKCSIQAGYEVLISLFKCQIKYVSPMLFFGLPFLIIISFQLGTKHQRSYLNLYCRIFLGFICFRDISRYPLFYILKGEKRPFSSSLLIFGNLNVHGEFTGDRLALLRQVRMKPYHNGPRKSDNVLEALQDDS